MEEQSLRVDSLIDSGVVTKLYIFVAMRGGAERQHEQSKP
jgi:hypothetical protein